MGDKLKKGFERLTLFDYYQAKQCFIDELNSNPAPAAYGLSLIYATENNPFYSMDSARKFILFSDSMYQTLRPKEKSKLLKYGVSDLSIGQQKDTICTRAYRLAGVMNSPVSWDRYVNEFAFCAQRATAEDNRNAAAMRVAKQENKSTAFKSFMENYPNAKEFHEAENLYQQRTFEEITADERIESYALFVRKYPDFPQRMQAERMIYTLSTASKTIPAYRHFVRTFPSSRFVQTAWREIYKLYFKTYRPNAFEQFKAEFPAYPFMQELELDKVLENSLLLPFERGGKWGYMNEDGKEFIKADYDDAGTFSEGLAPVMKNGKYGYISKSGKVVISFLFEDAEGFKNNTAVVGSGGKYGLINRNGDILLPTIYDELSDPSEDICVVVQNGHSGYVSTSGNTVVNCIFDFAGDFMDGYAIVGVQDVYGLINNSGKYVIDPDFEELMPLCNQLMKARKHGSWGIISHSGETIVPFVHDIIGECREGRILLVRNGKYGFCNLKGKMIVPMNYRFNEKLLALSVYNNGYVLVQDQGRMVPVDTGGMKFNLSAYDETGIPQENFVPVRRGKKWGYADSNGKLRINTQFDKAGSFNSGFATVRQGKSFGLIDSTGKMVIPAEYQEILPAGIYFQVKREGKAGLFSQAGVMVIPASYDRIEILSTRSAAAWNGEIRTYYNLASGKVTGGNQ